MTTTIDDRARATASAPAQYFYFSMALAGGGIHGGRVIGATDPDGGKLKPTAPHKVDRKSVV